MTSLREYWLTPKAQRPNSLWVPKTPRTLSRTRLDGL